jgi:membrane-bound lytic murein transglycosylase B
MNASRRLHPFRRRAALVLAAAVLTAVSQTNGAAAAPPGSETGSDAASVSVPEASAIEAAVGLAAGGIPSTAHEAYVRAAAASPAGCHIAWSLVAAIGRVESNHGRFAGAVLHSDGRSTPAIIGRALDGKGTALIRDTDGGRLDGDRNYDRAVGPMQFIPSTWRAYATDGDGDGRSDPFDIHDAGGAAAKYLCAAGRDLSSTAGKRRAVLAYNHSATYVATVLKLAAAYARKSPAILPTPPPEPASAVPGADPALPPALDEGPPSAAAPAPAPDAPAPDAPAPDAPAPDAQG